MDVVGSWNSISKLRSDWEKTNFKENEDITKNYVINNKDNIVNTINHIRIITQKLEERNFFDESPKIFKSNYLIYKFIISRMANILKNTSLVNRYIDNIIPALIETLFNGTDIIKIINPMDLKEEETLHFKEN